MLKILNDDEGEGIILAIMYLEFYPTEGSTESLTMRGEIRLM